MTELSPLRSSRAVHWTYNHYLRALQIRSLLTHWWTNNVIFSNNKFIRLVFNSTLRNLNCVRTNRSSDTLIAYILYMAVLCDSSIEYCMILFLACRYSPIYNFTFSVCRENFLYINLWVIFYISARHRTKVIELYSIRKQTIAVVSSPYLLPYSGAL